MEHDDPAVTRIVAPVRADDAASWRALRDDEFDEFELTPCEDEFEPNISRRSQAHFPLPPYLR